MNEEERQEPVFEEESEVEIPEIPEPHSIFSWQRMIQQTIVCLMIITLFIALNNSNYKGPVGFAVKNLHQAIHTSANASFGYIASKPIIRDGLRWANETWRNMDDRPSNNTTIKLVPPVPGQIKNVFGWNSSSQGKEPIFHAGVDLESSEGAPVRASADGTVKEVRQEDDGLWRVTLIHNGNWRSIYGNCTQIKVHIGEHVKVGQELASVGKGSEEGLVVHWEVWRGIQPVDPRSFL